MLKKLALRACILGVIACLAACGANVDARAGAHVGVGSVPTAGYGHEHRQDERRGERDRSGCRPGFTFEDHMCVGEHKTVDIDGPDPYRQHVKCEPGTTTQIKEQLGNGVTRTVDQVCRQHAVN